MALNSEVDGTEVSWSDTDTTSLTAGSTVTLTANSGPSGLATWTATTGTHTIMAWVDDVNRITESNENNNQYSTSLTVSQTSLPDLIVTGITTSPASPIVGDAVTFTATVQNQGAAAGAPGTVTFSVDGTQVSASANNTTALAANGTIPMSGIATWTATSGTHTILANVDSNNTTTESNESNNTYSTSLTVTPVSQPDLIVTGITTSPASPNPGDAVTFTATVKNQGGAAGAPGTVSFSVDGTQVTTSANNTTALAVNGTTAMSGTGTWTATNGTHTILANVDINNITTESNESNNTYSMQLTVGTPTSQKLEAESAALSGGATVMNDHTGYSGTGFAAGIQTSGQSAVTFTLNESTAGYYDSDLRYANAMGSAMTMDIYVNGTLIRQSSFPTLADWNTWSDKIDTLYLNAGSNTIMYKYDSNCSGNINLDYINVGATTQVKADLIVTGITYSPSSPIEGNPVTFSATVKNIGTAAGAAGIVAFQVDATAVTQSVNNTTPISIGGTSVISASGTWTSTVGTHAVMAIADNSNTTAEIDETNNSYTTSMTVAPVASSDLVISAINNAPNNPAAGNTVTFTANIKNQGTVDSASGSHGITLTVTDTSTSTVVATLNGSYSGVISSGTSTSPITLGTWIAVNGNYSLSATVAVDANELPVRQGNNTTVQPMFVGEGANMPYDNYEAESGVLGGGAAIVGPNRTIGDLGGEASGREAVTLNTTGSSVSFTTREATNTLVTRFSIPDSADGSGASNTLDVYVNGVFNQAINLTSAYEWLYGTCTAPTNTPSQGSPRHIYDEANIMFSSSIPKGSTITLQKDAANTTTYAIDFIQLEQVAPVANPNPATYVVPASTSQSDVQSALDKVRMDNTGTYVGVYLPAGNYTLANDWQVYGKAVKVVGAGPWYTRISAPSGQTDTDMGFSVTSTANGSTFSGFSVFGNYTSRIDGPGKVFNLTGVSNLTLDNIWVEHTVCFVWGTNVTNCTFTNDRIRDTFADGINLTNGSSGNLISNCESRATGDDSFTFFAATDSGHSGESNNTCQNCTSLLTWRAAGLAVYGGSNETFQNDYVADTLCYSGITVSSLNFGYPMEDFGGTTNFSNITLARCGGQFWGDQCFAAIWCFSANQKFTGIRFNNINIINPTYIGVMFQTDYVGGVALQPIQDTIFTNTTISGCQKSGDAYDSKSGVGIWAIDSAESGQGPAVGSATFNGVTFTNDVTNTVNNTSTFAININN